MKMMQIGQAIVALLAGSGLAAWMAVLSARPVDTKGWAGAPTPWPTPAITWHTTETDVLSQPALLSIYPQNLKPYHVREACARSLLGVYMNQFAAEGVRDRWIRRSKRDCPKDVAE
jgi:hypothetical protein